MDTALKIAFPTDEHYPYQNENARSVAMKIVQEFDPDQIITGSDGLDFYAVSNFDKDPFGKIETKLQNEIDQWLVGQREWMDTATRATRRYIPGNHEDRLYRWLCRHPEIADLEVMKLASILKFDTLNILGDVEREINYFDKLLVRHGSYVRKFSGQTAKAEIENQRYSISIMSGHTHRGGTYYARSRWGELQAVECFCLCDLNPHYNLTQNLMDWQNGIVLATVSPNWLSIEAIPFFSVLGKTVAHWRGKEYRQS